MKTMDKPLHVLCRGWVDIGFGARLMGRLHQEASACVVQSRAGVFELTLFDTFAPVQPFPGALADSGARVLLFSNHPTGNMRPTKEDMRNLAALPAGAELVVVCGADCQPWRAEDDAPMKR